MKKKIGIPRGMLYYEFSQMWESFFDTLGLEVVVSPETNGDILDSGISLTVDEACLPVKIYHGHTEYLKDKVDYLFIPRILSLHKKEYCCPKVLGLADMVINSIEDLPEVIRPTLDYDNKRDLSKAFMSIGRIFSNDKSNISKAYRSSVKRQNSYIEAIQSNLSLKPKINSSDKLNILILGHSYVVHDKFLNMDIVEKIEKDNINIILPEYITNDDYRKHTDHYKKRIFWTHGRIIVGSANYLLENNLVDGIIYLSSFGCGMDSALLYLVEQNAIEKSIPIMELILDEQTGDAGFNTRIEAFFDLLKWRYKVEDNFPAFR